MASFRRNFKSSRKKKIAQKKNYKDIIMTVLAVVKDISTIAIAIKTLMGL